MSALAAAAISIGSGVVSGIASKKSSSAQAAAAREQAKRNSELSWMTTKEELRRVDVDNARTMSSAKALSSASGFGSGSTQDDVIANLGQELSAERDWLEMSGEKTAENIKLGGEYTAKSLESQGTSNMIGSIMGGISQFGASQNWWMK